jgi:hypothetical protein
MQNIIFCLEDGAEKNKTRRRFKCTRQAPDYCQPASTFPAEASVKTGLRLDQIIYHQSILRAWAKYHKHRYRQALLTASCRFFPFRSYFGPESEYNYVYWQGEALIFFIIKKYLRLRSENTEIMANRFSI